MPLTRRTRLVLTAGAGLLAGGAALTVHALTGADADAGLQPAKASGAPHCRRITDTAPSSLGGLPRRGSSLAGVAVWGQQDIILRCGVTPPHLTPDPCFAVDGVDWIIDRAQSTGTRKVIVSYGRTPATQVVFDGRGHTDAALVDLSKLIAPIRQTSHCIPSR
ncbi:DUF3515 family protein [Streptomyces sp. WI03-4A]|uniref:DUF3515 family protein n=1 Tax=Streptomyces TaxID=1883 RepID=UPI0029AE57EC|nr:DUF3515 family protein [Streptomyces sp. WI03-4A]MDX2591554.1 DUF3515 family protein [Streptomyces sp. WI03-4A]